MAKSHSLHRRPEHMHTQLRAVAICEATVIRSASPSPACLVWALQLVASTIPLLGQLHSMCGPNRRAASYHWPETGLLLLLVSAVLALSPASLTEEPAAAIVAAVSTAAATAGTSTESAAACCCRHDLPLPPPLPHFLTACSSSDFMESIFESTICSCVENALTDDSTASIRPLNSLLN